MRPLFSRSLRDDPIVADAERPSASNESLGLIQDLATRLFASCMQGQPIPPHESAQRQALIQQKTLLKQNRQWKYSGADCDQQESVGPEEACPGRDVHWTTSLSTEHLEKEVQPVVRDRLRDSLKALNPRVFGSVDSMGSSGESEVSESSTSGPIPAGTTKIDFDKHFTAIKTAEIMAMQLAYQRPIFDGSKPLQLPLGPCGSLIDYTSESVPIALGLEAYGFIPVDASKGPPILLFRGTVTSPAHRAAGSTWLADLDPFGVGWAVFQFGSADIGNWLQTASGKCQKKALVIGHSLGGAHAAYAGVYHPRLVDAVLAFNPPASSFLAKRRWDSLQQSGDEHPLPTIWNFINTRDDISHLGQEVVGEDFFIHVAPEAASGPAFDRPGSLWAGHSHHSVPALRHRHVVVRGERTLIKWRYLANAFTAIPFLMIYAMVIAKRLLVGHASGSRYASLLGWASLILGALATVILQTAVLARLGLILLKNGESRQVARGVQAAVDVLGGGL